MNDPIQQSFDQSRLNQEAAVLSFRPIAYSFIEKWTPAQALSEHLFCKAVPGMFLPMKIGIQVNSKLEYSSNKAP